ncbi:hypothetical protein CHELA20_40007 [Hyphomicrobiales bacterium]|nr:hypothetical protein CHELA20_40007 [Hyphomicrobiales bacterium]CAH1687403.1 hypothetical protein CHELA41_40007 [Hyphomicrobiales bacterium]
MATESFKNSNSTDRGTPSDPPSAQEAQRRFSLKLQGYYHRLTEECNRSGEIQLSFIAGPYHPRGAGSRRANAKITSDLMGCVERWFHDGFMAQWCQTIKPLPGLARPTMEAFVLGDPNRNQAPRIHAILWIPSHRPFYDWLDSPEARRFWLDHPLAAGYFMEDIVDDRLELLADDVAFHFAGKSEAFVKQHHRFMEGNLTASRLH